MRGPSESDTPQAAMEIPCAWHVVTQKRETVLFGAEDKGAGAWEQTPARVGLARVLATRRLGLSGSVQAE